MSFPSSVTRAAAIARIYRCICLYEGFYGASIKQQMLRGTRQFPASLP
jgi:hypothetical protein